MTREEIISMAREAGAYKYIHDAGEDAFKWMFFAAELQRFAAIVAAAEREACAKLAERLQSPASARLAEGIRARSST